MTIQEIMVEREREIRTHTWIPTHNLWIYGSNGEALYYLDVMRKNGLLYMRSEWICGTEPMFKLSVQNGKLVCTTDGVELNFRLEPLIMFGG